MTESFKSQLKKQRLRTWTLRLYDEFDHVLYTYNLRLRRPVIRIVEEAGYWGQWDPLSRCLSINIQLIRKYNWDVVLEVLKHEMAHMVVNEVYLVDSHRHDQLFAKACDALGLAHWARKATGDLSSNFQTSPEVEMSDAEKRLLERLEKLLALSESDNEHESMLAMKAADKLKREHDLSRLQGLEYDEYCHVTISHKKQIVPAYQTRLTAILCQYFNVEVVYKELFDAQQSKCWKAFEIIGTRHHVKIAEYVYNYLWERLPVWQTPILE